MCVKWQFCEEKSKKINKFFKIIDFAIEKRKRMVIIVLALKDNEC